MSRPKGSKNKKTLISEAQLDDKIAVQAALKQKLEGEMQKLTETLEGYKEQLKAKKKELRVCEKELTALQEKKEKLIQEQANRAQKEEIEKVVESLIVSGKDAEEILSLLKN